MPSATRNTNANSGNAGSALAKWNTWLKKNALTPERGGEGQHHRHDQQHRREQRPQHEPEHDQDHQQHERDDQVPVVPGRVLDVEVGRRTAADQRVGAVDLRRPRRGSV